MKKHLLQLRGHRIFLSMILLLGFLIIASDFANAAEFNKPQTPILSLSGVRTGYDSEWYPDGRIWLPVTAQNGAPREFLLPVFIDNKWFHYKSSNKADIYVPDPIYSFEFKILFDSIAIMPVGIQKFHPFPDTNDIRGRQDYNGDERYYEPLARDFAIQWEDHQDMSYREYFLEPGDPPIPEKNRSRGRCIKIVGTSSTPLPTTDTTREQFSVLLYIRFRVQLEYGKINQDQRDAEYSPIYISPDTIKYNDWNVRKDGAFKKLRKYYPFVDGDYGDPDFQTGLGGMRNRDISLWQTEPILAGAIYLQLTEHLPKFKYQISRGIGKFPPIYDNEFFPPDPTDPLAGTLQDGIWYMRDPLTVDSGRVVDGVEYGQREFQILNGTSLTRLVDVEVESDSPWLLFSFNSTNPNKYTPKGKDTTKGYIKYLDNGILGGGADKPDPQGEETEIDPPVFVRIKCDPSRIMTTDEQAGLYVGYITFKSATAEMSPVRLRITFINFRNPIEPDNGNYTKQRRGMTLIIKNSEGATGQSTKVVFGTGHRASDGVDSLFGEYAYRTPLTGFGARFYHPDQKFRDDNLLGYGFGDFSPNDEQPYSESRDIRNLNDTMQSFIYLCRFNAGGAQNYPVSIMWDTTDFIDGAQLFISDTLNGSLFPSKNMREATHITGNYLGFAIEDPNITSFKIEYTIPRVLKYVDANNMPKIKKGWNLLSLPVRPRNSKWNVIYPNAMNRPYYFYNSSYQDEEVLRPGVGYFIKYSDSIDTRFAGVFMKSISKATNDDGIEDKVRIWPGWNTIGALTYPINVDLIDFDAVEGQPASSRPTKAFIRKHGIWGYTTNKGYSEVSVLEPGMGYWLKADTNKYGGYIKLVASVVGRSGDYINEKDDILAQATEISLIDNAQHNGNVYLSYNNNIDVSSFELPPAPFAELFDVRFINGCILDNSNESTIQFQGVEYPLNLRISNADANYTFIDPATGTQYGSIQKGQTGNIEVKSNGSNAIKILKSNITTNGYMLAAYPNPVSNYTTINYSIPAKEYVTIKLYDVMGNEIQTLVNQKIDGGENNYILNANNLANGKYICRLVSGNYSTAISITVVK